MTEAFDKELAIRQREAEYVVRSYLPEEGGFQKTVIASSRYSVENGGKRLRPILMSETYRLFDGKGKAVEPFMAAIEMIHSSSLVHDDLPCMDNDALRRGKPSTWAKYGVDMGTLAGDALMIYAFETAAKAFQMTASPASVAEAIRILAEKTGIYGMIGGQTLDVEKTGKPLTKEELDFIYRLKTGALIEASMMIGAVLAGASREDVENCGRIAEKVGYAFQIRDDILDLLSCDEELGKPVHSDERNKKTTYVSLYGLERAEEAVRTLSEEAIALLHGLTGENAFLQNLLLHLVERKN